MKKREIIVDPLRITLFTVVFSVILGLIINQFVFLVKTMGSSMEPTFRDKDWAIASRVTYVIDDPKRGDIVAVQSEFHDSMILKRIIAIPGDIITIDRDKVYLNGDVLEEDYILEPMKPYSNMLFHELLEDTDIYTYLNTDLTLEEDEYFIMGDNRNNSSDSRIIGPIKRVDIAGKIIIH